MRVRQYKVYGKFSKQTCSPESPLKVLIEFTLRQKYSCVVTDFPESSLTRERQLYHKADTFRRRHRCVRQHTGSSSTPKPWAQSSQPHTSWKHPGQTGSVHSRVTLSAHREMKNALRKRQMLQPALKFLCDGGYLQPVVSLERGEKEPRPFSGRHLGVLS